MISGKQRLLILLFLAVLVVDQITKYAILSTLIVGKSVPVIGDLLRLTLVFNPGGAFSLRLGNATYYLILSLIIFAVLIIYVYRHSHVSRVAIPLSIVAGGAAGNIIDRLRFGSVVDFIDCEFFNLSIGSYKLDRWPIFNVADMAVSCGIVATIVLVYYHSLQSKKSKKAAETQDNSPTCGGSQE